MTAELHSYTNRTSNPAIRIMATRTLVASCITTTTSITNALMMAIEGTERYWVCLMVCNFDGLVAPCTPVSSHTNYTIVLCSALSLFWATSIDTQAEEAIPRNLPPLGASYPSSNRDGKMTAPVSVSVIRTLSSGPSCTAKVVNNHFDELPDFDLRGFDLARAK